jgi:acyl-CoA reductase-like NAD-dependent aldehyde dehydrogenase
MLHIPILRHGQPYESLEKIELVHHATGEPVARVSQANSGLITRDLARMDDTVLERFTITELLDLCRKAGELFMSAALPVGESDQSFEDYTRQLSATTGMPLAYCKTNAEKIRRVLTDMKTIIAGLTRGFDLEILDRGYGSQQDRTLSFYREGRLFGAVLPSNSPGVHGLWIPAVALKTPIVLKPGREEPWTPLRVTEALAAAGLPREAFGFYPTDHAGAGELLRCVDRSMLFGDTATTKPWRNDPRVEIHGPGFSKVILGDDTADDWPQYIELIASSIAANCGRSCINASAVWTPRHARDIAEALAQRLANVSALPADDPNASIAAFANADMAGRISDMIDGLLRHDGAEDVTQRLRGSSRLVQHGHPAGGAHRRCAYLLPTIIRCDDRNHPLANREFLFPFASVIECPTSEMPEAIGPSLVVSAITKDKHFARTLMASPNVDRLNIGAIPTWQISWDQPHEGNLFEHLYRQRAFQLDRTRNATARSEPAA